MSEASYKQAIALLLLEIENVELRQLLRGIKFLKNEPAEILTEAINKHLESNQ